MYKKYCVVCKHQDKGLYDAPCRYCFNKVDKPLWKPKLSWKIKRFFKKVLGNDH